MPQGSHHTPYALPISRHVDPVTLTYPDMVTRVSAKKGSAIVFTEYMMHTTCKLPTFFATCLWPSET